MNINQIQVGDKVILLQDESPYYSGYAGNPVVLIKKGTIGVVGATKVPYVSRTNGYFVCVDFVVPDKFSGHPKFKQNTWRCGVNPKYLKKV